MRHHHTLRTATALAAATALLAACSDAESSDTDTDDASAPRSTPTKAPEPPEGTQALPAPDAGADFATLDGGRFWIPLDDELGFAVDVPQKTYAHDDGLFLASGPIVLKTEIAGEQYGVPADPCTSPAVDAVGPSVDDLVTAIRNQPAYHASRPEPVELGGAEGSYLQIRVPRDYDASPCNGGQISTPGNPTTNVSFDPGYRGSWWILDVEGKRVVVAQNCGDCSAEELDRAEATARSITFTATR